MVESVIIDILKDAPLTHNPNIFRMCGTNHVLIVFTGIKLSWDVRGCNVVSAEKIHELFSQTERSIQGKTTATLDITSENKGGNVISNRSGSYTEPVS